MALANRQDQWPFRLIGRDLSLHGCTGALSPSSAGRGGHVLRPGRIARATALSPALNCRRYLFGDSPSSRAARWSGVEARRKEIACCCSLDRPASRSGGRPGTEQSSDVSFAWWTCSASSLHRWCEQVARGSQRRHHDESLKKLGHHAVGPQSSHVESRRKYMLAGPVPS